MRLDRDLAKRLSEKDDAEIRAFLSKMNFTDLNGWTDDFRSWAHAGQLEPAGDDWRNWLMLAGRGYGKTRAGAEWVADKALAARCRIALVGATIDEARAVMVEGDSGLIAVLRRRRRRFAWEPALKRLRLANGSVMQLYSGENPDGLRGGNHHFAWCDELAKWAKPEESWDNLQLALRAGVRPRALATTTPRPIDLLTRIAGQPWTVATGGRMEHNLVLEDQYRAVMRAAFAGTRLERQELDGVLETDLEGALWTREMIAAARLSILPSHGEGKAVEGRSPEDEVCPSASLQAPPPASPVPLPCAAGEDFVRVVIGVDPPGTAGGDACGIVVAALARDGTGHVIADESVSGLSAAGWARAVSDAAHRHGADRVVAETNMGGEMVPGIIAQIDPGLPVKGVHASRGKAARAEPVALLYERGLVRHRGAFPELEAEMRGLTTGGGYHGPGRSPDRADALVWALTELMLGRRAEARVRVLG